MGYDHGDIFPFNFEPNGIPFGSKSKGKSKGKFAVRSRTATQLDLHSSESLRPLGQLLRIIPACLFNKSKPGKFTTVAKFHLLFSPAVVRSDSSLKKPQPICVGIHAAR